MGKPQAGSAERRPTSAIFSRARIGRARLRRAAALSYASTGKTVRSKLIDSNRQSGSDRGF